MSPSTPTAGLAYPPAPSPTTLVSFPDYTPNNLQVGRGYQRYKQWKTGQRLGMRPKTEQRLGMRPKTGHELGMRPKEQYPGYKEKPFLLIWMIPFYFHVVVESVHEKQLILLSDILCWQSTMVSLSLVPGPHHCLVLIAYSTQNGRRRSQTFVIHFCISSVNV